MRRFLKRLNPRRHSRYCDIMSKRVLTQWTRRNIRRRWSETIMASDQ